MRFQDTQDARMFSGRDPRWQFHDRPGMECRGWRGERGPRDAWGGPGRGGFGGFGGGRFRERLFDAGDLKLVILRLLSEQPSYGYQLIKALEGRLAGGYSPSAGVIYPTLTMLEEEGLATASMSEGNKRVYAVTAEGLALLEQNKQRVGELFAKMEEASEEFRRGQSPEIMKAIMDLRGAITARMARGNATQTQIRAIADAIHAAAKAIDEV